MPEPGFECNIQGGNNSFCHPERSWTESKDLVWSERPRSFDFIRRTHFAQDDKLTMDPKISRLVKITLLCVAVFIIWSCIGLIRYDFSLEMLWGTGIGFLSIFVLALAFNMRRFGYWRGLGVMAVVLALVYGALILNAAKGWPFGFLAYHDILGWKTLGVSWPLPILWSAIIGICLIINQPKTESHDPKKIFSWAFDTGICSLAAALIIEPLARNAGAMSWSSSGSILGVPGMDFLGWFLVGFVASFSAILIMRIWREPGIATESDILLFFCAFCLPTFLLAWKLNLVLIQILSAMLFLATFAISAKRILEQRQVKRNKLQEF